ncbi:MAG TPA: PadR family transcriptional regulator [Thermomicrobiaceae bacterium]|nr:PadR family transcriptional regulator [Thermomicrobiaceae bacterium]
MSSQPQPLTPRRRGDAAEPARTGRRSTRALPRTPLALAVLNLLNEHPMHPYEMKSLMRERGHVRAIRLKDASLYDTVERLAELGFIEAVEVSREGRRPERTVYAITDGGRDELVVWLRELTSLPSPEYPRFAAALMFIYALGKDGAIAALSLRAAGLEGEIARIDAYQRAIHQHFDEAYRAAAGGAAGDIPRLFTLEEEYAQAMRQAELAWVRQTIAALHDGTLEWPVGPEPTEEEQSS